MGRNITTIAYKDGILAADSRYTEDHLAMQGRAKIVKLDSGLIIGSAGDVNHIRKAEHFLSEPNWQGNAFKGPKKKVSDWEAIAFWQGQVITFSGSVVPELLVGDFYAIGSGWELALSALALGKSAKESVEFAAQYDIYTGGPVQLVYLNDKEKVSPQARTVRATKK